MVKPAYGEIEGGSGGDLGLYLRNTLFRTCEYDEARGDGIVGELCNRLGCPAFYIKSDDRGMLDAINKARAYLDCLDIARRSIRSDWYQKVIEADFDHSEAKVVLPSVSIVSPLLEAVSGQGSIVIATGRRASVS